MPSGPQAPQNPYTRPAGTPPTGQYQGAPLPGQNPPGAPLPPTQTQAGPLPPTQTQGGPLPPTHTQGGPPPGVPGAPMGPGGQPSGPHVPQGHPQPQQPQAQPQHPQAQLPPAPYAAPTGGQPSMAPRPPGPGPQGTGPQGPAQHMPQGPGPGQLPPAPYATGSQPPMAPMPGAPMGPPAPQGPPPPAPVFPPDAMGATQQISAVPAGRGDNRPLFRDEVPEDAGADTAQFDVRAVDDYDDYDGGYDDYAPYDDSGAKRRKALMIGGFALALVLVGGGTFYFASGGPGASSGGDNATTVANEEDDPGALSSDALFPETLEVDGQGSFTRVAVDDTEDCAAGAHGDYGAVLADNGCRQLVRASYLSEDEGQAVTVGIAAMADSESATTALDAQNLNDAQWFAGLPGEEGSPAERLGHAGGHGSGGQWGRYLLFSLATNSDGAAEGAEALAPVSEGFLEAAYDRLSEDRG